MRRLKLSTFISKNGADYVVEAAVRDTQALRQWSLGRGSITVLAPAELRASIRNELKAAAACY